MKAHRHFSFCCLATLLLGPACTSSEAEPKLADSGPIESTVQGLTEQATNTAPQRAIEITPIRTISACYGDADGDGFGAGSPVLMFGACPAGMVGNARDCNDNDAHLPTTCYGDADHDGAPGVKFTCNPTADCQPTFTSASDPDDSNASIHPVEATELANNGIDENNNGWVDEIEYDYAPGGHNNGWRAFDIRLRINNRFAANLARTDSLVVTAEYRDIRNFTRPMTSGRLPQVAFASGTDGTFATYQLANLTAATVYYVHVRVTTVPSSTAPVVIYPVTPEPYWSMTDGYTSLDHARMSIVLSALFERDLSLRGLVQNGGRYGASSDELWCSEFFAWVTRPFLAGMDPGAQNNVNAIKTYFSNSSAWHAGSTWVSGGQARPGDYLGTDPGNQGSMHHSEMYLGYDAALNLYFSVAGNCNNRVCISHENPSPRVWGTGSLTSGMLRPTSGLGAYCQGNQDCAASLTVCEDSTCVREGLPPGASCDPVNHCGPGLHCQNGTCAADCTCAPPCWFDQNGQCKQTTDAGMHEVHCGDCDVPGIPCYLKPTGLFSYESVQQCPYTVVSSCSLTCI